MSEMNTTPSGERLHITLLGCRNAGKSSLINALTGQNLAIVSEQKGTTTDPVQKSMELLPLGPVVIIDTPGLDDDSQLGKQRIERALMMLNKTDIALLVIDASIGLTTKDKNILNKIYEKNIPALIVFNKIDLAKNIQIPHRIQDFHAIGVSALTLNNIEILKKMLGQLQPTTNNKVLVSDLVKKNDTVILVTPIDSSAPKGRIILPQQQVLRDLLDHKIRTIVIQPDQLLDTIDSLKTSPALVITDSQVFETVNKSLPPSIPLTSFSILFARYKGNLNAAIKGAEVLATLKNNDNVLISEGCTHHRQCGDIGTQKLPNWIKNYTHSEPKFKFTSGGEFPTDLSKYKLVIHCGACMLTPREIQYRYGICSDMNIPITNYGIAIAKIHGILERSIAPLKNS